MARTAIHDRLNHLLRQPDDASDAEVAEALTDGFGHALALDGERLRLERRITALAIRAEDPETAQELRSAWLRHRTVNAELSDLRGLLRAVEARARPQAG